MKVGEGEKILSVAVTEHSDEEPTDLPETPDADAGAAEPDEPEIEEESTGAEE